MNSYKTLDSRASSIITKLQNEINRGKIYENQGQKELRQFEELVDRSELMFAERLQLKSMLSEAIDNLKWC